MAADLLGEEQEYKKSFDIHTSYKALKKAVERAGEDGWANLKMVEIYWIINSMLILKQI